MGVSVVVEEISDRKAADDERDAIDVPLAGQLVGSVGDILLLAAETPGLLEIIALRTDFREGRAGLLRLAIGKTGKAERAVQAKPLRQLRVEIELATVPQAHAEEGGRRPGVLQLPAAGQAVRPRIGRAERWVALCQERGLGVDIPIVGLGQG